MIRAFLLLILITPSVIERETQNLTSVLVNGVERKLERMRDLSADFIHIYEDPLNRTHHEEGHLYLRRPRMMRWEYHTPEEKLFVSDGESVHLYLPGSRQVNRESVDETFDDRIPLMFLLGRSELSKEFNRIDLLRDKPKIEGTRLLRMYPRRDSYVDHVLLEVNPLNFDIRRLRIVHKDGAASEFLFSEIESNIGLDDSLFDFEIPPGVQLIDGIG